MAEGNVGKFRTYSQEERGQQMKAPRKQARIRMIDDEDDEPGEYIYDSLNNIPARFTQKWDK